MRRARGTDATTHPVTYRGATMQLDLLDREGKYSNGFCHW